VDPGAAEVAIRPAAPADYDDFTRLFPELGIDDPLPPLAVWTSAFVPYTRVALSVSGGQILGYCYTQEYDDTGYVRHLVVAPDARRRGVGRALMQATAQHLRAAGKTGWRLNVGSRNPAAVALYEGLGLRTLYRSHAVRFPFASADALRGASVAARELPPARDAEVERLFAIPRGQIAAARATKRLVLGATTPDGACVGLAVFAPSVPGAFPFRVLDQAAVRPLLDFMRPHVVAHPHVNLAIDDDDGLVSLLVAAGGEVRGDFLHLGGAL
jgi:ribosomal protein S18 acetylase RimI-like enzyme